MIYKEDDIKEEIQTHIPFVKANHMGCQSVSRVQISLKFKKKLKWHIVRKTTWQLLKDLGMHFPQVIFFNMDPFC